jgi:Na+/proline symporter
MFSSAIAAAVTILWAVGGGSVTHGFAVVMRHVPELGTWKGYVRTGFEEVTPDMSAWETFKQLLNQPYTILAALVPTTIGNMAAFGTDQDMVQRMLTAKDARRSRRSLVTAALMDLPIAVVFSFIGILLIAFYDMNPGLRPASPNDVFGTYILKAMPTVVRGFVLAGVFATAMGSLSAALNALATTLTNDWYIPYFAKHRDERHHVAAARVFTGLFAVLMAATATFAAWATVHNTNLRIIPIALGVAGFVLGPMLGVFLVGMLTRTRGSDNGNIVAVTVGLITIVILSGLHVSIANWFVEPGHVYVLPWWLPQIPFTWYAMIGAAATFGVGLAFRTPPSVVASAAARRSEGRAAMQGGR